MEQTYFYDARKAKAVGCFLLILGLGCVVAVPLLKVHGMINGAFMLVGDGISLIQSKRRQKLSRPWREWSATF